MSQFSAVLNAAGGGSPVSTSEHSPSPTPDCMPDCFEGPEKTMEVCFIPGIGEADGLRKLSRKQLDFLCTEAKCSILSKISSAYMDAYVLSESSLFIYKHRYIMKTCGTTTLLHCLDSLLRFADELKMELMWVGYSRKNLLFPTQQAWPHSNFGDEIEYLNSNKMLQDRLNGVAHILGPVTGDHWFVYVADNPPHMAALIESHKHSEGKRLTLEEGESSSPSTTVAECITKSKSTGCLSSSSGGSVDLDSSMMTMEGVTVNMMMFDLDREVAKLFYQPEDHSVSDGCGAGCAPQSQTVAAAMGKHMTKAAGIDHLVPGATIDETSFCPCGYSMNAILHDAYSTIHITPEPDCSYASFETNTTLRAYSPLVRNALNVFRPKRFVLTMFADDVAYTNLEEIPTSAREFFVPKIGMYRRTTVSSTNIGAELNCTMACFTLVTGEVKVQKSLIPKPGKVSESNAGDRGANNSSVNQCDKRMRGNSVDLTNKLGGPMLRVDVKVPAPLMA
mmetsp:Transcript_9861/g.16377  ORF Transcript_9861/g.16377 Transcript_9861/m.16377 type:complete len:505 (-) Transcript_9861:256-1770(-)|eukprot:CAMPEP_0114450016 /NCGR_PEP_ID=MMETSP0104-20121206/240_1 /TAXON_ID=37642 ORGANISM="Paraphysomonas imperforata, Strain PA2" /NCGR_SAMPLE_ID=MMETSP0104 /ASSEMBLY_ACC=CAM_ASM_000202 /LENGTH=504 /DNA_ID=CAMNT_0001622139 /DNA_START=152 /DNA_END=1666 /DNA_ORIENTATION=+